MAEEICFFTKDSIIIKPPKKSPALLRMVVVVFTLIFGIYICSICLKQTSTGKTSKYLNIEVIQRPCHNYDIDRSQMPYVHYPKPKTFSRGECACNSVRLFAILSMQRSGSGWFETLLNSHMNVSSNGEIFSVKDRRENASSILRTLETVYNLDFLTSASKNHCSAAVGFKWMLNQVGDGKALLYLMPSKVMYLSGITSVWACYVASRIKLDNFRILQIQTSGEYAFPHELGKLHQTVKTSWGYMGLIQHHKEIVEYFNVKGVSVIFLFRRNLLRRMVSVLSNSYDRYAKLLNGTHKSHVHSPDEAGTLAKYKPEINTTLLITDLKKMEIAAGEALEYFNSTRHMILYYEDIVRNRAKLVDVLKFLRLPEMDLSSRQVKIHYGPVREHIKNWDDVNKTLSGTAYEIFLQADY